MERGMIGHDVLILGFAVAVIAAIFLSYYYSRSARIKRALRKTPRVDIASIHEGAVVKLVGRVDIDEPLRSPLSRRRCAYFEAVVEEHRSTRNRSSWVEVIREVGSRDFRLRDESGEVTVAVREEDVALTSDVSMSTGFLKDPTPELEAFLAGHGQSGTGWIFNRSLRYREGVLGVGERVAVLGVAQKSGDRWIIVGTAEHPLRVSDDPSVMSA
jgi:hypothetical protein